MNRSAPFEVATLAGGCFWCIEAVFKEVDGVENVISGYIGGTTVNPTCQQVCTGETGHAETVEVLYDPSIITFEKLTMLFFQIHDPTQINRQGPDIGEQYLSAIFYVNDEQKKTAERLVKNLRNKGYNVATELTEEDTFWEAGEYHQDYYIKTGKEPYCHIFTKRF